MNESNDAVDLKRRHLTFGLLQSLQTLHILEASGQPFSQQVRNIGEELLALGTDPGMGPFRAFSYSSFPSQALLEPSQHGFFAKSCKADSRGEPDPPAS